MRKKREKHPIQKIRRPMPPPTKVKPNKKRERDERTDKQISEELDAS